MSPPSPTRHNPDFRVIDESADYIVVEKPPHLLVHPSKPGNPPTLWDGLRGLLAYEVATGGQVSIINRLDRETSGLVLAAKTRAAARHFSIAMQERRIRKEYLALVWGWPETDGFTVREPLRRRVEFEESPIWLKQAVHPEGAPAHTQFSVERRFEAHTTNGERFSIVRCRLFTGRMHQIRVHLAHRGHPVVGDKIYGPDEGCYLRFIETGWTDELLEQLLLPRHALHSALLELPLPDGSDACWRSPAPADFSLASEPD